MSQDITITTLTANTPAQIFYCDALSAACQYVSTISVVPFTFNVPSPYSDQDFVIKIIDNTGCTIGETVFITPTGTPGTTPTPTQTQTQTTTQTPTNTQTQTNTGTPASSPTNTPTVTTTNTPTPVISFHLVGQSNFSTSGGACVDSMTVTNYYTYISEANFVPVTNAVVYTVLSNGVLYLPLNGGNRWFKLKWGNNFYATQINSSGQITSFSLCS